MERRPDPRLQPGDRVFIDVEKVRDWRNLKKVGPGATIMSVFHHDGSGAGEDLYPGSGSGSYGIRLDGYDYGPGPTNCHTAHWSIINSEPTEDEIAETLASIASATEILRRNP